MNLQPILPESSELALSCQELSVYYGNSLVLKDINLDLYAHQITTLIGPSGCGKSTLLRCFNRLNDLVPNTRIQGKILFKNKDIYRFKSVEIRRRIGMVFQKPNPFPKSIYENIALGLRINGYQGDIDEVVEYSLRQATLWDEVKNHLNRNALTLSGGQQQRLCIARAIALKPEILLMDEPCSSLDPVSTAKIDDLLYELKQHYTIVMVTHNMQQASRVSDMTAFFNIKNMPNGIKVGYLSEYDLTEIIFHNPKHPSTQEYVTGRFY
ncbi:phosphate ABC transporter ATP-binding protein PstB [Oxynema aestuarii]|jgi:phosphate transport system ATP-binding protein|uniref:Phosphate ABC transporter ATP-binding protein n=1 Tax=Oxynema aestuarii AP17 TaxID=2064643 RepID=A0A6H1TVG9_9CYAN|nr:phosphate ABC transporter ATP-binding protein PstB [Oxynema aestuarii]QIZ69319.1 phosphate ABC transporter ATP-binding protein [Oxynema aestuarii AP17]RMH75595.1 MAG: phosphate ABC transporter ATP-binding protein [Cyanobacteria bacterium J007]